LIGFIEIGACKAVVPKRHDVRYDLRAIPTGQRVEELGRLAPPGARREEAYVEHPGT
jgi:hypothetical protein